jgi:hypothetical protein
MRSTISYGFLLALRSFIRLLFRVEMKWLGEPPASPWLGHRLVIFLHHTSLYEPVFLGGVPEVFLRQIAYHGVLPAADKTIARPFVGWVFKLIAAHVIPITRTRDQSWFQVLRKIDPDSLVVITPEGRMMRRNGLDSQGKPMTVRGGVVDILEAIGEGTMIIAYSGGLHHVQAPGERAHLFQTVRMNLQIVSIAPYLSALREGRTPEEFRRAVCQDLEARRAANCPIDGPPPWPVLSDAPPSAPLG